MSNFVLGLAFKNNYKQLRNPKTLAFLQNFQQDIHKSLGLSANEYVVVTGLEEGSVVVSFVIILKDNSTITSQTVQDALQNEINNNATGSLEKYLPHTNQTTLHVNGM